MINEKVVSILQQHFPGGFINTQNNYVTYCQVCRHHKPKLQISLEDHQQWHCWICHTKGGGIVNLLRKYQIPQYVIDEVKKLIPKKEKYNHIDVVKDYNVELPKEFIQLAIKSNSLIYTMAMNYLNSRGIYYNDIVKYNIGYCTKGKYQNMIIIPSYDKYNFLNFFTAHSFIRSSVIKFRNAASGKNIIGFENTLSDTEPIIIVESPMDAIILKRNATPLFGTVISETLYKYLIESNVQDIYICLDGDALKSASKLADELIHIGKNVYQMELQYDKDPGDLGYEKMWELIEEQKPTTENKILKNKLKAIFNASFK